MTSIQQRLTRTLLPVFAVLLLAGGLGVFVLIEASLSRQFDAALRAKVMAIAEVTRQQGGAVTVDRGDRFLREFDNIRNPVAFFEVFDADGAVISRSLSLMENDLGRPEGAPSLDHPSFWNVALPTGDRGRIAGVVFVPRMLRDDGTAFSRRPVALVVANSRRDLDRSLATIAVILSGGAIVLLAAIGVFVPRVLRRALSPLSALGARAAHINAASLSMRFESGSTLPAELAPISEALNDLLARLEQSFERERQITADLAHELRTPLAELRSVAEVALRWPDARDPRADRDVLDAAVHMEAVVERLLELHRAEGGTSPETEPVDVVVLVDEVWQPFRERAMARHLHVECSVSDGVVVETNRVLLRSILSNLFDNAVAYTPDTGVIRIDMRHAGGRADIAVSNTVDRLTSADVPRLFDRFWRADPARHDTAHSGLGLSIARALARAMRCELAATLDGSCLTMTLSTLRVVPSLSSSDDPGKDLVTHVVSS
ncbi:MAG TPA: ATP-binding protein [Vicinamibacterales bacterium]|nr:ATP-binding protein [Vicinamibacterales bacterium]